MERAARLAERQFGSLARWQLPELGCTRSRISHWREVGRLHDRYPGVGSVSSAGVGREAAHA